MKFCVSLFAATLLLNALSFLRGQSCVTSCPTDPSCVGQGYGSGCGGNVNDKGSDPICTFKSPDPCQYPSRDNCPVGYSADGSGCCVHVSSPIILDLDGTGFDLSSAADGVWFTLSQGSTDKYQIAWLKRGSGNAWLVLDRNGNGTIDDLSELFGNETQQPAPPSGESRNGFAALDVFDHPDHGGNGDGWITKEDSIFESLRVWRDDNHDGLSQTEELHTLDSVGVQAISLKYSLSKRVDAFGNDFRYKAVISDSVRSLTNKTAFDVFLMVGKRKNTTVQAADVILSRLGEDLDLQVTLHHGVDPDQSSQMVQH
jgi:hypothetical protein